MSQFDELRAAVARANEVLGCQGMPCRFKATTGQTTNGRCSCVEQPHAARVLAALYKAARRFLEAHGRGTMDGDDRDIRGRR